MRRNIIRPLILLLAVSSIASNLIKEFKLKSSEDIKKRFIELGAGHFVSNTNVNIVFGDKTMTALGLLMEFDLMVSDYLETHGSVRSVMSRTMSISRTDFIKAIGGDDLAQILIEAEALAKR